MRLATVNTKGEVGYRVPIFAVHPIFEDQSRPGRLAEPDPR